MSTQEQQVSTGTIPGAALDVSDAITDVHAQAEMMYDFIKPPKPRDEQGRFAKTAAEQQAEEATPQENQEAQSQEAEAEPKEAEKEAATEETEEQQEPEKYTVKRGEEEFQVTLDEALKGYMRNNDYTQKTQQLASERKAVQSEFNEKLESERKTYLSQLSVLQKALIQAVQPELGNVNWQQLANDNPAEFVKLSARASQVSQLLAAVKQQQEQLDAKSKEESEATRSQRLAEGYQQLAKEIPDWSDELGTTLFNRGQKTYGLSTKDDGLPLENPKWVKILHDAHQYRKMVEQKPMVEKKVQQAQTTIKPGSRNAPQNAKAQQLKEVGERFKKTGSTDDLADYFRTQGY